MQRLHLHGADGSADLQAGVLGGLDRIPDSSHALSAQLHGNSNDALLHRHGDGLDPQAVDAGILNAFQFDDADTQLIQELR